MKKRAIKMNETIGTDFIIRIVGARSLRKARRFEANHDKRIANTMATSKLDTMRATDVKIEIQLSLDANNLKNVAKTALGAGNKKPVPPNIESSCQSASNSSVPKIE